MTDQHTQDHRADLRRPLLPGRTRMIGATLGGLLSLVIPTAVVAVPGLTADGHTVSPPGTATGADFLQSSEVPSSDPAPTTTPTAVPDPTPGAPTAAGGGIATPPDLPDGPLGIPGNVLDAYQFAQKTLADTQPGCHLSWLLLAGIGRIESDHADGGRLDAYGTTLGPILGPLGRIPGRGHRRRHRPRRARRRHRLGPGGGPDAVPARHLAPVGHRWQRRRGGRPEQHLRRHRHRRALPVRRRR